MANKQNLKTQKSVRKNPKKREILGKNQNKNTSKNLGEILREIPQKNPNKNPNKNLDKILGKNKSDFTQLQSKITNITRGKNFCVVNPLNLYGCDFGDNCFVGPFVEVQDKVKIGHNCRIQSHSFICALTTIGDNCFIGHGVMFVNDLFDDGKPSADKNKWRGASIGNCVSIGSNATILPVKICDNVVIGAGSVVTKNITKSGIYAGNPAKKLRDL